MKKKIDKKILTILLFIISITFLIYGMRMCWIGYHNNDLGFNLKYINCEFNATLIDINTNFEKWSPNTMIITGARQMDEGFYISLIGAILLGFAIGDIHYGRRK